MALFCKKTFFCRFPLPVSFANALRPDCPSRKFRGQQNYSENSESTEETESAEGTEPSENSESAEGTEHSENSEWLQAVAKPPESIPGHDFSRSDEKTQERGVSRLGLSPKIPRLAALSETF